MNNVLRSVAITCIGLYTPIALADLVAATLPTSRSVEIGQTATAFATVINAGTENATGCRIEAAPGLDVTLSYQTTDATTNIVTGTADTPVALAAGAAQSFVLSVTPNSTFSPQHLELRYLCDGGESAVSVDGLNTLLLSSSSQPVADLVAIAQTASMDGVLDIAVDGTPSAFAAAVVNVGAATSVTAQARASFEFAGELTVCQTNAITGECLATPATSAIVAMGTLETATFSIFVASSQSITTDFANNRLVLEFFDTEEVIRGATSVAARNGAASVLTGILGVVSGGVGLLPGDSTGGQSDAPVEILVDVGGSGAGIMGIGNPDGQLVLSGSGLSAGAIDAFGSIITNGRRLTTSTAEFSIDGMSGSQDDLKVGQDVLVVLGDSVDAATAVIYRSKVKGPITQLMSVDLATGAAELVVLGQRVRLNAATIIDDTRLDALAVGQLLEVSGVPDADGVTVASFIELKSSLDLYKVVGVVSGLSGNQFTVGDLMIDFSNAVLDDFDSAGLVEGQLVEIKANPGDFQSPSLLFASKIEPMPSLRLDNSASVQLEGFIDDFESSSAFSVQRQRVQTTSATTFINGTSASLALGVKVDVRGNIDADGVLTATSVRIKPTEAVRAEGVLTSVDGATNQLSVLGVTFQANAQTELEDKSDADDENLTFGELQVGQYVAVRGYLDGDTLIAVEIEREDADSRSRLRGPVSSFDAAAETLEILGVTVTGQLGITQYEDRSDQVISKATFYDMLRVGDFVKTSWDNFTSTAEIADEITLED